MSEQLPYQLMAWIKKDQEERKQHQEKMALKYAEDDKVFMNLIKTLIKLDLNSKEKLFICSLLRHKKQGKNWSPGQKSAIANLFYKKSA